MSRRCALLAARRLPTACAPPTLPFPASTSLACIALPGRAIAPQRLPRLLRRLARAQRDALGDCPGLLCSGCR